MSDLGTNTPEKNSSSIAEEVNPLVISLAPDGTGPKIKLEGTGVDAVITIYSDNPADGSVTIALSACQGQNVTLQAIPLCMNGVSGRMIFLCGQFIPD